MQFKKTVNILSQKKATHLGFTIVELLIVIVVIGILAAITIVAYSSVTQRSHVASLVSDLGTAAGQLNLDNGSNGSYPASAALANNGAGLKPSPGTTFTYTYAILDNSYCLIGTKNGASYYVAEGIDNPVAGTTCPPRVTTLAGSGTFGFADGMATSAQFRYPKGIAIDSSGTLYVTDMNNYLIRKITPAGVVTTFAGSSPGFADGTGSAAKFSLLDGIAVDSSGTVYVADIGNNRIRKITPTGIVTTLAGSSQGFADGTGSAAQFNGPYGLAIDSSGILYVADTTNHRIRKITPTGVVTTLAGSGVSGFADGTGSAAQFSYPLDLAVDSSGTVYVADSGFVRIRKITPAGVVTTFAGSSVGDADGIGTAAQFRNPQGVALDSSGTLYVTDGSSNLIRKITPAGVVTTFAGSSQGFADGSSRAAQFINPSGIAIDSLGSIYVADTGNNRIRKIQ